MAAHQLSEKGYFQYGKVTFFANGTISDGTLRLSLKKAKANGSLGRGIYSDLHAFKQYDSFAFWVSETEDTRKRGLFGYTRTPVITFSVDYDLDVIEALINSLA